MAPRARSRTGRAIPDPRRPRPGRWSSTRRSPRLTLPWLEPSCSWIGALDRQSLACHVGLFFAYYLDRQYDLALEAARDLSALDSADNPRAHGLRALAYLEKGMYEESVSEVRKASQGCRGHLGNTYARAGKVREARECLREIRERVEKAGVGAYDMALVHAGLGEKDQAFEWLERASEDRDQGLLFLKVDPPSTPCAPTRASRTCCAA
jgi:tetratricopeptide (TPR) repeat protein